MKEVKALPPITTIQGWGSAARNRMMSRRKVAVTKPRGSSKKTYTNREIITHSSAFHLSGRIPRPRDSPDFLR